MKAIKRLVVKGREYTTKDGKKKAEWVEIGRLMQREDGTQTILLNTIFNLNSFCKDSTDLWVNLFDVDTKKDKTQEQKETKNEVKETNNEVFDTENMPAEVKAIGEYFNDKTDVPF